MLPPKIGEGVLGSSSGGVNPTGASSLAGAASVFVSSAAKTLTERDGAWESLRGLGVAKEVVEMDCFHEAVALSTETPVLGTKRLVVAWVAMAMAGDAELSLWCEEE